MNIDPHDADPDPTEADPAAVAAALAAQTPSGADLTVEPGDPQDWDDLDAWIDGVTRPTKTVYLYNALPPDQQLQLTGLQAALADAEARLTAARVAEENDVERSVTDTGSAAIEAEVADAARALIDFRDAQRARAMRVEVTQVTIDERVVAEQRAAADGVDPVWRWLHWGADKTTLPGGRKFTPAQLRRLAERDVSGQQQVVAIKRGIEELSATPTVPSSPESSTSRGGRTSSAS